jgi:hypothetical protein
MIPHTRSSTIGIARELLEPHLNDLFALGESHQPGRKREKGAIFMLSNS